MAFLSLYDYPISAHLLLNPMVAAAALSPTGDVYCTWLDVRSEGTALFGSASRDGGKGPVIAVWEAGTRPNTSIMAAVVDE